MSQVLGPTLLLRLNTLNLIVLETAAARPCFSIYFSNRHELGDVLILRLLFFLSVGEGCHKFSNKL